MKPFLAERLKISANEIAEFCQKWNIEEFALFGSVLSDRFHAESDDESEVITIIKELLTILDFVHSYNVIHRDIKLSNIIRREEDNKLVLIDFGAVKQVTSEGQQKTIVIGTPGYIPIEQFTGQPNFRSDIYAVVMIGIQALTGIKPQPSVGGGFPHDSQHNLLRQKYEQVSDNLGAILTKMTRYDYRERYSSAQETLQKIQEIENSRNTSTEKSPQESSALIKKILVFCSFIAVSLILVIGINRLQGGYFIAKLPLNGKLVKSVLDSQDNCDILLENIYCEQYLIQGKSGQQVTIEMNSDDFDPYLVLQTPDGNKLAVNGDISPDNWNAKIAIALPSKGNYLVMARTSVAGESGNYSIRAVAK
ncbi:MAG: hypothetical protein AAF383_04375 [Cyanobacteria bacterium P01_A01_bin.83]